MVLVSLVVVVSVVMDVALTRTITTTDTSYETSIMPGSSLPPANPVYIFGENNPALHVHLKSETQVSMAICRRSFLSSFIFCLACVHTSPISFRVKGNSKCQQRGYFLP